MAWTEILTETTYAGIPSPKIPLPTLSPTRDSDLLDGLGGVVGDVDIDIEGFPVVVQLLKGGGRALHELYLFFTGPILGVPPPLSPSP